VHYRRAPIVEAIIDLHVRFSTPPHRDAFEAFHKRVADKFLAKTDIRQIALGMHFGPQQQNVLQKGPVNVGIRLSSDSPPRVLQAQQRGFTYSHLAPYTEWETFRDEARPLWNAFVETCRPEAVTRVAVRFVNRIIVKSAKIELVDYFNLYPHLPERIPQDVTGMFLQLRMPQDDIAPGTLAIVNQTLDESNPVDAERLAILLDFDVFRLAEYPPSTDEVWALLEKLRTRKNELFEASITDRARDLFL
jgi:uncharacterized protein (TIGR04255 family)